MTVGLPAATAVLFAVACASGPRPADHPVVDERWVTTFEAVDDVDSVAVAIDRGWVVATTKGTHQLLVLDAATGAPLRRVGAPGDEPGRFRRPNGIAVADDLVLVVERDNHRVQILGLPDFEPLGTLGEELLERPYGIAVAARDGGVDLWVTDNFELPGRDPAGNPRLAERVKQFHVRRTAEGITAEHVRSFGETSGRGALWKVETIAVDPVRDRLLIAEESAGRMGLVVYTTDGRFTGRVVGADTFRAEPEGVGLWPDGDGGVWVATDQHAARSVFHLFDRATLEHLGAFSGAVTANTDGIAVVGPGVDGFPAGAVVAVHDDHGVAAFDWVAIDR
jgi:3-phytase